MIYMMQLKKASIGPVLQGIATAGEREANVKEEANKEI